ncbi:MAG: flagellar basal body L-ring protein FlgH [Thermoguttaceae bacterium]
MKKALFIVLLLISPVAIYGQSGSLTGDVVYRTSNDQPLTLRNASFTYQPTPEPRSFKVHDRITVIIDEKMLYTNNNDGQRQRKITGKMGLTDWIRIPGWGNLPEPITTDPPVVGGVLDHQARNKGQLTRSEKMSVKISCEIIDILPNGDLRIKGQDQRIVGEEEKIVYFSGVVPPKHIKEDDTVMSDMVGDKDFKEIPSGNTFDGIKRGYGQRWIDRWMPF